jgi:hypothetical protein
VGNFYTDVLVPSPVFHSTQRVRDLQYLEPVTRAAVLAIIAEAKAGGIELMIYETYRSQELQQIYFERGATKLQKVGVHHYGLACDLVKVNDGQPSWEGNFDFLGDLTKKRGLIWGGDWGVPGVKPKFVDADHVQRCAISMQNRLFAGTWYPDDKYSPFVKVEAVSA